MFPPLEKPDWDYEHYPNHKYLLPLRAQEILFQLRKGLINCESSSKDNRPQHKYFFKDLTQKGHEYFAGNYRGSDFPGLKHYEVTVTDDSRVGVHSSLVDKATNNLAIEISLIIAAIDKANSLPNSTLNETDKLVYIVRFACKLFVEFLRIHPYANGNGHMGRFFIFSFLGVFGIWPKKWPLNDRPPDPPYSFLIKSYRDGNYDGLEMFILRAIIGK